MKRMKMEALVRKAYDLGFQYEREYHGCCQCTIAAVQDALGLRNDYVFKAGSGLAVGMGCLGNAPCGGYTGGAMVLSCFFGRVRERFDDDIENRRSSYRLVRSLHDRYIETYGSFICNDVQEKIFGRHFNLLDEQERAMFEEAGGHRDKCTGVVASASAWTCELVLKEIEDRKMDLGQFHFLRCIALHLY